MITVISSLIGFLGAGLPKFMEYFQDKQDKKHELEIMDRQMQMARDANTIKLQELQTQENIQEIKSLYKTFNTGIRWVDALNGLVRPIIAFALIGLYIVIEYMIFYIIGTEHGYTLEMLEFLWSDEDQALFAGIISYYFGSRAFSKS